MGLRRRAILLRRHYKLLVKTWLLLLTVRITLTFKTYKAVLQRIGATAQTPRRALPTPLLIWAVEKSSRLVPRATCLTRALTLRWLLAQAGESATIAIGVRKDDAGAFKAHAWVVQDGQLLIGGPQETVDLYQPIASL